MLNQVFQQRRSQFLLKTSKYLKYVFNDHFVLVLFFLFGYFLYSYQQLLANLPSQPFLPLLAVFVLSGFSLFLGHTATYLEEADRHFLLAKEEAVIQQVKASEKHAILLWGSLQIFFCLISYPLFYAYWGNALYWGIYLVICLGLRIVKMHNRMRSIYANGHLDWDKAINLEKKRQHRILSFFALFTTVKGITTSVKRRSYLDGLLEKTKKHTKTVWDYLYLRAFIRGGDYFALSLRLVSLALLSLLFIQETMIAVILAIVMNYLLLFQLVSLYQHFDYQYLTQLYPVDSTVKKSSLKRFLMRLTLMMSLLEWLFVLTHIEGVLIPVVTVALLYLLIYPKITSLLTKSDI